MARRNRQWRRSRAVTFVLLTAAVAAACSAAPITELGSERTPFESTTDSSAASSGAATPGAADDLPVANEVAQMATDAHQVRRTTTPVAKTAFVEDFTGNVGFERFERGVYHRDEFLVAVTEWEGDHDLDCGTPDTTRTIHRDRPDESFYVCRDHVMTSMGDTSGYSIAWFSPKQSFSAGEHTSVSFAVNVTDLLARQWWEVSIVPVGAPFLATVDWVASVAEIDVYDPASIVIGSGPYGNDGMVFVDGESQDPLGWGHICGDDGFDPEGCGSQMIRRPFTVTDNLDGTVSFEMFGETFTYPGAFPEHFEVYFKDHNYRPDKDGEPVGYTWHWDDIRIE